MCSYPSAGESSSFTHIFEDEIEHLDGWCLKREDRYKVEAINQEGLDLHTTSREPHPERLLSRRRSVIEVDWKTSLHPNLLRQIDDPPVCYDVPAETCVYPSAKDFKLTW